jgi:hypothetical protein
MVLTSQQWAFLQGGASYEWKSGAMEGQAADCPPSISDAPEPARPVGDLTRQKRA